MQNILYIRKKSVVPKSVSFINLFNATGDKTDYSGDFDGLDLTNGGAITLTPTSRLVVGVGGHRAAGSPNSLTSVSTGLGAMTAVQNSGADLARAIAADATMAQMFIQNTGTTSSVDLDVVWGVGQARMGIGVWIVDGTDLTNTAEDAGGSTADPGTDTLTTTTDGFGVGYCYTNDNGTVSWTNFTERDDETIESAASHSAADVSTSGSNVSPSADYSGSNANRAAVFATF